MYKLIKSFYVSKPFLCINMSYKAGTTMLSCGHNNLCHQLNYNLYHSNCTGTIEGDNYSTSFHLFIAGNILLLNILKLLEYLPDYLLFLFQLSMCYSK